LAGPAPAVPCAPTVKYESKPPAARIPSRFFDRETMDSTTTTVSTAMVAITILAEALVTVEAWDTVEAQGVAIRVKVGEHMRNPSYFEIRGLKLACNRSHSARCKCVARKLGNTAFLDDIRHEEHIFHSDATND
jgi:hypothetical protein